ncbi:hypothetical protein [Lacipirellula sp.]|uniref:hypothetical protein n=1 Tax=Lacipirellula sp. TaxID=2691419 RepID=UPI003D0FF9C6
MSISSISPTAVRSLLFAACLPSLLLLAVVAGCDAPAPVGPAAQSVQGSVVYQGKPANGFRVTFYPQFDIGPQQFAPSAMTDAEGKFTLTSYKADDGAPAGKYAVAIEWPQEIDKGEGYDVPPTVDGLKGRFADPVKSKWQVDVLVGENRLEPFQIP